MKPPDLASLDIPRARKGEAAPIEAVTVADPGRRAGGRPDGGQGRGPIPATAADEGRGFEEPPETEVRSTVSVRLPLDLQERLRLAAFRSRRRKQDIIEAALADYLGKRGY